MVLFTVNGERNSGTNFLNRILIQNGFPVKQENIKNNVVYNWKHGVPSSDYKKLNEKVVDLFLFRNLNDWLISMYKNPYHLTKHNSFNDFLTLPQISNEDKLIDYRSNKCLNDDDNNKTIFNIREYKFNKILEYKKKNKNVILINLEFIQNEKKLADLLDFLCKKYMIKPKKDKYLLSFKHTKCSLDIKNRVYDINIDEYKDIINSSKNEEIENYINKLTFEV